MAIIRTEYNDNYNTNGYYPDAYEYDDNEGLLQRPPKDFIIARDTNGYVVSRYSSSVYDYTVYTTSKENKLYFKKNIPDSYVSEAHWLVFLLERVADNGGARNGNTLSIRAIYNYFMSAIRPICHYASEENLRVDEVLSCENHTTALVNKYINKGLFVKYFPGLISKLHQIGKRRLGYQPCLSDDTAQTLQKKKRNLDADTLQTPLIPPRIYLNLINHSWQVVSELKSLVTPLSELIRLVVRLPKIKESSVSERSTLRPFLKRQKLIAFLDKYYTDDNGGKLYLNKEKLLNIKTLKGVISDIQSLGELLIHLYTGMRDGEVRGLPLHCFNTRPVKGGRHAKILGYTYKYAGFQKNGEWVTTDELKKVFDILSPIAKALVSHRDDVNVIKKEDRLKMTCPLFVSSDLLIRSPDTVTSRASYVSFKDNPLLAVCDMTITEGDLQFLERIDPIRHWRSESDFTLGCRWPLAKHQFRRSLAVYARASGLVEIGSVQYQLKHLFDVTSYYYANGAENAEFDITSENHIADIFADNQDEADFMLFIHDVIFSNEKLHGAQGRKNQKIVDGIADKNIWILENQAQFIKDIKNGKRAYKETALGGCESVTPCNKKLLRGLTACLSCVDADIKESKLTKVIKSQHIIVSGLLEGSIDRRMEQDDLDTLLDYQKTLGG